MSRVYVRGTQTERFLAHVAKIAGGCWLWTASTRPDGYGQFAMSSRDMVLAHRASWLLLRGPIPDGAVVCHTCDNPPCVNPDHLFLGSQADNLADMRAKGRHAHGSTNGHARVTEGAVRQIRQRLATGERQAVIASEFGLSPSAVSLIATRRTWAHV